MIGFVKKFIKGRPTKLILRLSMVFFFIIPWVWTAEELFYIKDRTFMQLPHNLPSHWHQVVEPGGDDKWCIVTLNNVDEKSVLQIANNVLPISDKARVGQTGESVIGIRDMTACDGVRAKNIYWAIFNKSQKRHQSEFLRAEFMIWLSRLFYAMILIFSLRNIINKRHAKALP